MKNPNTIAIQFTSLIRVLLQKFYLFSLYPFCFRCVKSHWNIKILKI